MYIYYPYLHHHLSSSRMTARPIKVFNAFDLQFECNKEDQLHLQEIILYCEVRFRVLLSAFGRAGHSRQRMIQRGLHIELVSFTSLNIGRKYSHNTRHSYYLISEWPQLLD
jgi:hypothetical protein